MISRIWEILVGSPLPTGELAFKRLNKLRALAAFSPDALSSIAYANQEIFLALVVAGSAGLQWSFPIGIVIIGLLLIVALSYYQTIFSYPSGGGSYVVARENMGETAGLVAAASLMIDYVLTVAVSLTAGVEALASAFPALWQHHLPLTLFLLVVITIINLRGVQESGTIMSVPVYLFILTYLALIAYGLWSAWLDGPGIPNVLPAVGPSQNIQALSLILILRAFASGCTALTGIEAISNGVPTFERPEAKNAGKTLAVMAVLMGLLMLGSLGLIQYFGVISGPDETILSALARRILSDSPFYYLVQISTLMMLVVAANTSFAGFPRLVSILAQDKFLPRQFQNLGDRLVYSNGMVMLAFVSGFLIVIFGGVSHLLVPLFAVGAFLAFTLSQAGMVVHWFRLRGRGWQVKSLVNGLGTLGTGTTLIVVGVSKFIHGAWLTFACIAAMVWFFKRIHMHFEKVARELSLHGLPPSLRPAPRPRLVVPIGDMHRGTVEAINYARSLTDRVSALYIEIDPGSSAKIQKEWSAWFPDIPLDVVPSPYRSYVKPLLDYLDQVDHQHHDGQQAAVLLPEIIPARGWQTLLHNQNAWLIKTALLYRRRSLGYQRMIIDVPFHLKR